MIKKITLWLMQHQLQKTKNDYENEKDVIIKNAKFRKCKSYETTILYLN